jgi:hypothetical protein
LSEGSFKIAAALRNAYGLGNNIPRQFNYTVEITTALLSPGVAQHHHTVPCRSWDREQDVVYLTKCHRLREATPIMHAAALKAWVIGAGLEMLDRMAALRILLCKRHGCTTDCDLLHLDARFPDDQPPLLNLGLLEGPERFRFSDAVRG